MPECNDLRRCRQQIATSSILIALALTSTPVPAKDAHSATGLPRSSAGKVLKTIEDLPNFHEVHPFLYRSGEPTEAGLATARDKYNIKTLIDLRGSPKYTEAEKAWAKKLGMNYVNLPMSSEPPTKAQVTTMMKAIREARDKKTPGAVLVHCAHGSDRTGCMIGIWRVMEDNYTYDQAYAEMRRYWFTPKFTQLSGAVRKAAEKSN